MTTTGKDKAQDLSRPGNAASGVSKPEEHREDIRQGGMEPAAGDPLGEAPTREGYGARAGASPAESGAPNAVTHKRLEEPDEGTRDGRMPQSSGGPDPKSRAD